MKHLPATCPFVQVVDILGNDFYVKVFFQFRQTCMACIRTGFVKLFTSFIVKVIDGGRITS